jgi:two-component system, OmpR family, sensor histidine kinase BaeS
MSEPSPPLPPEPVAPPRPGPGLAARLFGSQLAVVVAGAVTLGSVALAVAPRLFELHLDRAGETDPMVRSHTEEAFGYALGISLAVAAAVSIGAALLVSGLVVRRLTAPVAQLAGAADQLATGRYDVALPQPRLGVEFDRLTGAFAQMADRLSRVEMARQALLSDLAHELRTPLSTLAAHVDGIEDGVLEADPATLQVMRDQLGRLQRLITDLAQLSAAEEHALSLRLAPVDLAETAAAAVEAFTPRYLAKPVAVVLRRDLPVPVLADGVRVQQVLANLLDNALRHTPVGGTVTVAAHRQGDHAVVTVTDTGPGIPADQLDAVFERFHRVDPARSRVVGDGGLGDSGPGGSDPGGSGLGLTIARAIVADHGGTLTASSNGPGHGTTITLRMEPLPADRPPA